MLPCRPDIWFDGVDPALIAASREDQTRTYQLYKPNSYDGYVIFRCILQCILYL